MSTLFPEIIPCPGPPEAGPANEKPPTGPPLGPGVGTHLGAAVSAVPAGGFTAAVLGIVAMPEKLYAGAVAVLGVVGPANGHCPPGFGFEKGPAFGEPEALTIEEVVVGVGVTPGAVTVPGDPG